MKRGIRHFAVGAGLGLGLIALARHLRGTKAAGREPKSRMNDDQTTKSKRSTKDVPLESASPTGHEEIEAQMAVESSQDGESPPAKPASKARRQSRKQPEPDQKQNPRRQKHTRPN